MWIETKRLVLRALEENDNQMLKDLINDPDTEYLLGGWSFPVSSREQDDWYSSLHNTQDTLRCIIEEQSTNQTIGTVMLTGIDYKNGTAEIHIKLSNHNSRGKGYGTETVNAIIEYAFNELRLNCIFAQINAINNASCHMFEKCGFKKEGVLRERLYKRGQYIDMYMYSVLKSECEK